MVQTLHAWRQLLQPSPTLPWQVVSQSRPHSSPASGRALSSRIAIVALQESHPEQIRVMKAQAVQPVDALSSTKLWSLWLLAPADCWCRGCLCRPAI